MTQENTALTQLFREAIAWGSVYGPVIPTHQWDEMRDSMAAQFVRRVGGVQALSAGPEDMAKGGVGKSGFDYRTAADLMAGHAVSADALSKFVQEARWAHGYKESYAAQNLELLRTIAARDAEIELLKKALMDAEEASPTPVPR